MAARSPCSSFSRRPRPLPARRSTSTSLGNPSSCELVCSGISELDVDSNQAKAQGAGAMSGYPSPILQQRCLIDSAQRGHKVAFRRLIEPHRRQLHAHCRRSLGSVHDADDALQETLLRAWRGLPRFDGRSPLRSWLYRIATNVCRDAIKRRASAVVPIGIGPGADDGPAEPASVLSPAARYEQRESVELAVAAAVQHLPPGPRAALVLSDVLGF